jgi:hypothetical protein
MKKYIPVALIALLAGTLIGAIAQPAHDHSQHAAQADAVDMTAMREEMQKKMQGMHDQMHPQMHAQMGGHDHGHMKNMPADGDMQKRRQQMQEQMSK